MIIAGPCLYTEIGDKEEIERTADALVGVVDVFRCKLWGGGTSPDRYMPGIGHLGLRTMQRIQEGLQIATEIQSDEQVTWCNFFDYLWIGARNASNYSLLESASKHPKEIMIKRNPGQTIDEVFGLYDIMTHRYGRHPFIIERGILTFDRNPVKRWSLDLAGILRIKTERPDIFSRLVVDCSHSAGKAEWVEDTYICCKAAGVNNFMFECTYSGDSKTDKAHMITTDKLREILC